MSNDTETWIMRELDQIGKTVTKIDSDVEDVKNRVTRLEASTKTIAWLIGTLIAGTPVLFLIFDRITT